MWREQQELFRKHGINQFAMMGGCLPVLLQLPIFMGLYYCLQESIAFRLQPFYPGLQDLQPSWFPWLRNLAAPDMLLWWSESIPFISDPASQVGMLYLGPYLNLLPVLAVTLMLVHMTVMAPPPTDEQMAMNLKIQKYMMIFFGFMFYKVAAGLCIYFIASSLWGLAERRYLPKAGTGGTAGQPAAAPLPVKEKKEIKKPKPEPRKDGQGNGFFQRLRDRWRQILKEAEKQKQARRDDDPDKKRKRTR
jgi:YidC/Oxa1 family membrane protein insertase